MEPIQPRVQHFTLQLILLEYARHCGASLTEYTPRTCVHRNCESGLLIIYKHAAHRLVQHRLQVVEMAWTDDSTLAIFTSATGSLHSAIALYSLESSANTGTVSQATKTNCIDILPCSYVITLATE